MADTLPAVTSEVKPLELDTANGHITATSLRIAEHFGKKHKNVLRDIQNLEIPDDYRELNFELTINRVPGPKGAFRDEPMYHVSRDGFALLAMGFTGKEAMRWKIAYIKAFNAMEAKLRGQYVTPLVSEKEFRDGVKLRSKLVLMEQSHKTVKLLTNEVETHARRNLYLQLLQINDTLGIATESAAELLGSDAPTALMLNRGQA